ncbi:MAG: thioester reductase domain-containing protein [Xanthobacteraceae bacterium]
MDSIFETLLCYTQKHPQKLLFSFLDLGGREMERYTYEAFVKRANVIAGHLRREYRFQSNDRILLAYPPGLEIICAFFGCVRAGLIPVPVYPPSSHGFQAALYKMAHIAKDCDAAGVLTSRDYYRSITTNLERIVAPEDQDSQYVSNLKWIASENLSETASTDCDSGCDILFLQYTSGSTTNPRGVMVTHANILHNLTLVANHSDPVAVSWLPQYHDMGLIGYYLYSALAGGTTYGFSAADFIRRPALWFDTITRYQASASSAPNFAFEYCLRPGRLSEETLEKVDLSSLRFLMTAAEPVRPATYQRFLQTFEPCGLNPEHFVVAYGLAENTLAVTSYGRTVLSINKNASALRRARAISRVSEISAAKQIISCGKPLGDVAVKIVDPEKHIVLEDGDIGEIWLGGKSKCRGYWNKPELTQETFHARIIGGNQDEEGYLRTGDVGFLHDGELYVCGRMKDMVIVRGQNYYPQDIETVVEEASDLIRRTCVVAFEIAEDHGPALAVVAEVKNRISLPNPRDIAGAIRKHLNLEVALIALVAPRTVPKTSSGKIIRYLTRQMWLDGKFQVLQLFSRKADAEDRPTDSTSFLPFHFLKNRYGLTGTEPYSLAEAGVDSLDLIVLMHEIQELLKERGADMLAGQINVDLILSIRVAELFRLADMFERSPEAAVLHVSHSLLHLREEHRKAQEQMMSRDRRIRFALPAANGTSRRGLVGGILLTGGTGFLGPFLLKSLLEQNDDKIYVLVRASGDSDGKERIRAAMQSTGSWPMAALLQEFERRVIAVCGDMGQPNLGLSEYTWDFLADHVQTIYHNAAAVNYLFNYDKLQAANVAGTHEVLRLAFERSTKVFNYVSTTFIFGWAVKETLYETDSNDKMELLDFGYSQSKWAAEQTVLDAARYGLKIRIFRPSLISPSVTGGGNNIDIAIRLLAFMVNHGIGVAALNQVSFVPADVAANNIVAISNIPDTIGASYHVTRDDYANMMDITNIMTSVTGRSFRLFKLSEFVPEVIRRCTKNDLLFPLLDFLIGSVNSISAMEFKRYDSSAYQKARNMSGASLPDPSLEDTVYGILRFMERKRLIRRVRELDRRLVSEVI